MQAAIDDATEEDLVTAILFGPSYSPRKINNKY